MVSNLSFYSKSVSSHRCLICDFSANHSVVRGACLFDLLLYCRYIMVRNLSFYSKLVGSHRCFFDDFISNRSFVLGGFQQFIF